MSSRQRRELTMATALTMIVLLFLICNLFKFIINLIEFYEMIIGKLALLSTSCTVHSEITEFWLTLKHVISPSKRTFLLF